MSQIVRSRGRARAGNAPGLHVFRPQPGEDEDRDIIFDIYNPGAYRLRIWTESEWALLAAHERPEDSFDHAGLRFAIDGPD